MSQNTNYINKIEICHTIYGTFYSWKGDLITKQLQEYSAHTRNEIAMISSFIDEGFNIIDIGAHIGTFAVPFTIFNKGKGKIFAFEACPENFNLLRENIKNNNLEEIIIPINGVVSSVKENSFQKRVDDKKNSGTHFFQPATEDKNSCIQRIDFNKWYRDSLEPRIDFLKIDVEGAEIDVLASCKEMIKKNLPIIYIEINQKALARFGHSSQDIEIELGNLGYKFFRNIYIRNSSNDRFEIACINTLKKSGNFDLLAIHAINPKCPSGFRYVITYLNSFKYWIQQRIKGLFRRVSRLY